MKKIIFLFSFILLGYGSKASWLLLPMDEAQKDHLKAYGITYWVLQKEVEAEWLLNYRAGSFLLPYSSEIEKECLIRGVTFEKISDSKLADIHAEIAQPEVNMETVKLFKAPKIAVYSPKTKQPWDDAVTLVLTYAEIPYTVVFDDEVLGNELPKYDWLHLHHEDFMAAKHGYSKVSDLKEAVAKKIRDFVSGGGFLFAMCSATDTYDIALAADGVDICESVFDGDPSDANAQKKLNYNNCFAFRDFQLIKDPMVYEFSTIDVPSERAFQVKEENDVFGLFDFSAKWDVVPTMLCQDHTRIVKGFYGQTTAFRSSLIKPDVLVMGENKSLNEAKYIHGVFGKGTWTFFAGHDPEDYQHQVGEPPTDMKLHPNSPGYRLILNNVLFPSAKKKKQKT